MNHSQLITASELSSIAATKRFTTKAAAVEYLGNEKLECLLCGKLFDNLGQHTYRTHGVSAREYKLAFNLPRKCGLEGARLIQHRKDFIANRPDLLEMAALMGEINGSLPKPHKRLSPLPVYEDCRHNARVNPPVLAPQPAPPALEEFKLRPNGRFAVTPTSKPRRSKYDLFNEIPQPSFEALNQLADAETLASQSSPALMKGYDKKSLMARVERLEKALTILLNANALALSIFEDK